MEIPGANILVMCSYVVFALVIRQILFSWMPSDIICVLGNLVTNPEISHFHRSRSLTLNSVVCYADCGGVITMYVCPRLGMAKLFKC